MTRAYPDQRVAWLWEDGWILVRATTERERDRLLGRFAGGPTMERSRNFLREPVVPLFLFDALGHRRTIVSVDAERRLGLHQYFAYTNAQVEREDRNGEHFFSLVGDLGAEVDLRHLVRLTNADALARAYWPGRCPDPACEADVLLGNLPCLFTCPTAELS